MTTATHCPHFVRRCNSADILDFARVYENLSSTCDALSKTTRAMYDKSRQVVLDESSQVAPSFSTRSKSINDTLHRSLLKQRFNNPSCNTPICKYEGMQVHDVCIRQDACKAVSDTVHFVPFTESYIVLSDLQAPLSAAVLTLLSLTALSTLVQAATNYTDADILQFALNLEVSHFLAKEQCCPSACSLHSFDCIVPQVNGYIIADAFQRNLLPQCLEAEYYSWGAYGVGIASVDSKLVGKSCCSQSRRPLSVTH